MHHSESERLTRKARIDPKLRQSGWTDIRPFQPAQSVSGLSATALEEYETTNGPADYALCHANHLMGIVEAKKVAVGPQSVLVQAERYARGIVGQQRYANEYGVPFLYATNGEGIWFRDVRDQRNRSREVARFHTPSALTEMLSRDQAANFAKLALLPQHHRMRPYQIEANTAIEQAIQDQKRRMLLAMATGTGKTLTMVNEVYRLMKSGVARRVLFLVDRRSIYHAYSARRHFTSDHQTNQPVAHDHEWLVHVAGTAFSALGRRWVDRMSRLAAAGWARRSGR